MTDAMRSEFEEWAVSEGMPITRGHYYDVYASAETRAAYLAWQAARTVPEGMLDVVREIVGLHSQTGTVLTVKIDELADMLSAAPEGKK